MASSATKASRFDAPIHVTKHERRNSYTTTSTEPDETYLFCERIHSMTKKSPFFLSNPPRLLPCFHANEVQSSNLISEGEFGSVLDVTGILFSEQQRVADLQPLLESMKSIGLTNANHTNGHHDEEEEDIFEYDNITEARESLRRRCWRDGKLRYAMKRLRTDVRGEVRETGALDMALEAKFLASLTHPNIIRLQGIVGMPGSPDFALLFDKLYETLSSRIAAWKSLQNRVLCRQGLRGCLSYSVMMPRKGSLLEQKPSLQEMRVDQTVVTYDIARVLRHLHKKNIIFRDLKPGNIGFDIRGVLRLFDFGLAKEVTKDMLVEAPDGYLCTGMTGSIRWMAPEVHLNRPYGPSADVYSFGLLCYNIFYLKTPFADINIKKHYKQVILKGKRPKLDMKQEKVPSSEKEVHPVSKSLKLMMRNSWGCYVPNRPNMREACSIIRCELTDLGIQVTDPKFLDRTLHSKTSQQVH